MPRTQVFATFASSLLLLTLAACGATPGAPSAPTALTATSVEGAVQLAWTDTSVDETAFVVYRAEGAADLEPLAEVDADVEHYLDESVHVGVSYRFAVAARNAGGASALAEAAAAVGPLPLDDAVTGRLGGYGPGQGSHAVVSAGVTEVSDPGGGPGLVSFGDVAQSGAVDTEGVLDVPLEAPPGAALHDEDFCGTSLRVAYVFTVTVATVALPEVADQIGAFAGLTNTGGRDPFTDARVGDEVAMWLYAAQDATVAATCVGSDTTTWTYGLDLAAGWNAVTWRVDAVTGGVPSAQMLTSETSGDLVWTTRSTGAPAGVLLEGAPESLAAEAAYDLTVPLPPTAESEIEFDASLGNDVLRTEIDIEFVEGATVAQVNALLEDIGGRIVSMVRNTAVFVVRIEDPGSVAVLDERIAEIVARPEVAAVFKSLVSEPDGDVGSLALPDGLDPTDTSGGGDVERVDHQLAVRAHAAWNLRALIPDLDERPWLVIGDWFGDGAPDGDHDVVLEEDDFGTGNADDHGYHVLGIATGLYGPGSGGGDRDDVTGTFPATLNVRAADFADTTTTNRGRNLLMQRINDVLDEVSDARIVVNTSLGYTNDPGTAAANGDARQWIAMVRNNDLEDRFLHATSAGNGGSGAVVQRNSLYTFSALGAVTDANGAPVANLSNVLVIENRTNTFTNGLDRPAPGCASVGSTMGGHLSAIGRTVWSFGSSNTADGASNQSGTSMSTPQVVGLAAFVWSLDPTLEPQGVAAVLTDTARVLAGATTGTNGTCNTITAQPVIDALDALLAVGGDGARLALLNLSGGSLDIFDHFDLEFFFLTLPDAPTLDYGRADLNGDGVSDPDHVSTRTERLDLDSDGAFGVVNATIGNQLVAFDETALTDIEVACYFAHSSLYGGGAWPRGRLLGSELLVAIAGARIRHVPVERDGAGNLGVDDVPLFGGVTPPRCTSTLTVDASGLDWLDEQGIAVGAGPRHTLTEEDMRIGTFDAFAPRTLTLRYEADGGASAESQVSVIPCARSGSDLVGYPECPFLIGDFIEGLGAAFGQFPSDVEAAVARAIHGIPEYQDVLDALGFAPCDPRFCDPFPPGFPHAQVDLRAGWYGDRGEAITESIDGLFEVLGAASLEDFERQLDTLQRSVASESGLSATDRELFGTAVAVVLAGTEFFAPASAGGEEGWTAFGFVADPAGLVEHVEILAPVRRGLEGFLTSIVIRNARSGFAIDLDLDAAAYAMSLEAFDQASVAAMEGF